MGNAGSTATKTWSRACAATGKAIGDGPDLLFIQSLSTSEKREALACMKEEEYLKAKIVWLDQMISNTLETMAEEEQNSKEGKKFDDMCNEYNKDKLQVLTKLKLLKVQIQKLRKLSLSMTGKTLATPITATVSVTGGVLKKTGSVVIEGTKNSVNIVSGAVKGATGGKEANDVQEEKTINGGTNVKEVVEKEEPVVATEAERRESVVAKKQQIHGLVKEAKSFESHLKEVEEETISEAEIEKRMKELEENA
eukprot:g2126.t1